MSDPITIFYSYAQSAQDEVLRNQLDNHLKVLEHSGRIAGWHRREVRAGQEWANVIDQHLTTAQIILLLISPDFIASPYCYGVEMKQALVRHERGEAIVIPILLRPVFYEGAPFAHLSMLPTNGKPVTSWAHRDEAFTDIAAELNRVLQELSPAVPAPSPAIAPKPTTYETHFHRPTQGIVIGESNQVTNNYYDAQKPAPQSSPVQSSQHCDVLLVTATLVEVQAVLTVCQEELKQTFQRHFIGDKTYYDLGRIGGATVRLVQSEMGTGGPGGSLLTVQEGIRTLSPTAVIMVGIAFGMKPGQQRLGDILVSRQLLGYELQRVSLGDNNQSEIIARGDRPQASTRLLDRFRSGLIDWQGPEVHIGLILSGEKLIDHPDFREHLKSLEPEAIGGEMEGAGLYAAAQRNHVDWLLVKAICDWADGKKSVNKKQRQQQAAQNATRFTIHVLLQGGFSRSDR